MIMCQETIFKFLISSRLILLPQMTKRVVMAMDHLYSRYTCVNSSTVTASGHPWAASSRDPRTIDLDVKRGNPHLLHIEIT